MDSLKKKLHAWSKSIHFNVILIKDVEDILWKCADDDQNYAALYIIIEANTIANNALETNNKNEEMMDGIYKCTVECCKVLSPEWKCKNTKKLIYALYRILKYLIFIGNLKYASNLSVNMIQVCNSIKDQLDETEKQMMNSIRYDLIKEMDKIIIDKYDNDSIINLWELLFNLNCILNHDYTSNTLDHLCKFVSKNSWTDVRLIEKFVETYIKDNNTNKVADIIKSFIQLLRVITYDIINKRQFEVEQMKLINAVNNFKLICPSNYENVINFCYYFLRVIYLSTKYANDAINEPITKINTIYNQLLSSPTCCIFTGELTYFTVINFIAMRKIWNERHCFQNTSFEHLFTLILAMENYITKSKTDCKLIEMTLRNDSCSLACFCNYIAYFTYTSKNLNEAILTNQFKNIKKAIGLSFHYASILEKSKSEKYINICALIGATSVNIVRSYSISKCYDMCAELSLDIVKAISKFEENVMIDDRMKESLTKLLTCLCDSYIKLGKCEQALEIVCIWCIICQPLVQSFMDLYVNLKCKTPQPYTDLTLWDILMDRKEMLEGVWNVKIESDKLKKLLYKEIDSYIKHRGEEDFPVVKLYNKIHQQLNSREKRSMKHYQFEVAIAYYLMDSPTRMLNAEKFFTVIEHRIKSLCKLYKSGVFDKLQVMTSYLLATMNFLHYRYKLLLNRNEDQTELARLEDIPRASTKTTELGVEEIYINRDVISSYANLRYDKHLEMISKLDTAVQFWYEATRNGKGLMEAIPDIMENCDVLEYIKETALIYKLHCLTLKEVETWKLLYHLSNILENDDMSVFAFSNLLTSPWSLNKEWNKEVSNKLSRVQDKIKIHYHLSWAHRYFYSNELVEGLCSLTALKTMNVFGYSHLYGKYQYLQFLYWRSMPKIAEEETISRMVFKSYLSLMSGIKSKDYRSFSDCCEVQCFLIEISLAISKIFLEIRDPIYARLYLKSNMNLVQKLSAPLRTCQFLSGLTWADTLICDTAECRLKLDGLSSILHFGIESVKELEIQKDQMARIPIPSTPNLFTPSRDLRCAVRPSPRINSPAVTPKVSFQFPEFLFHDHSKADINVDCNLCYDLEYHRALLDFVTLKSIVYFHERNKESAKIYFKGTMKMLNRILNEHDIFEKYPELDKLSYVRILFYTHYADFCAWSENLEEALKINKMAIEHLNTIKPFNKIIAKDLFEQKVAINYEMNCKNEKQDDKVVQSINLQKYSTVATPPSRNHPAIPSTPLFGSKINLNPIGAKKSRKVLFDEGLMKKTRSQTKMLENAVASLDKAKLSTPFKSKMDEKLRDFTNKLDQLPTPKMQVKRNLRSNVGNGSNGISG